MSKPEALNSEYSPRERTFATRLLTDGLVVPTCKECSTPVFPLPPQCPICRGTTWAYPSADGQGRIVGYTRIQQPSDAKFDPPVTSALIRLAEGPSVIGRLEGDPEDLSVGDPVTFTGTSVIDGHLRLSFERTD